MAPGEQDGPSEAPESRLGFSLGRDHVSFDVDETVYPLEAIYGGSYLFVDRCFVFLSRPSPRVVNVRLTSRGPATPAELDALAGEFLNELLSQVTRVRLSQATARKTKCCLVRSRIVTCATRVTRTGKPRSRRAAADSRSLPTVRRDRGSHGRLSVGGRAHDRSSVRLERSGDAVIAVIDAVTGGDRQTIENSFCNLALQETIVRMRRAPAPEDE